MNRTTLVALAAVAAMMAGCENLNRSLVFSTGTTIGVEIGVKPQSEASINLLIGYKRAEVLFDPVMEDVPVAIPAAANEGEGDGNGDDGGAAGIIAPGTMYKIKENPHSILAKLLGDVKGSAKTGSEAGAGITVSQWFASGRAAEILAASAAPLLTENAPVARAAAAATMAGLDVQIDIGIDRLLGAAAADETVKQTLLGIVAKESIAELTNDEIDFLDKHTDGLNWFNMKMQRANRAFDRLKAKTKERFK